LTSGNPYPDPPPTPGAVPTPSGVSATGITCTNCGYNLTGVAIGSNCPECGTPVDASYAGVQGAPTSGKAITAMVLGICSIVTCWCYGIPGIVCSILAIVFWKLAKTQIKSGHYSDGSSGMGTAGLATGIAGGVLSLLTVAYIVVLIVLSATGKWPP